MKKNLLVLFFCFLFLVACAFAPQPIVSPDNLNDLPVTNLNLISAPVITDFGQCVAAGNPVMESYPRQCRIATGQVFTEIISQPNLNQISPPKETACKNECGNGICQDVRCFAATGCPCPEDIKNCPQDCLNSQPADSANGYIKGKVSIGPICPVQRADQPCAIPETVYTSRSILAYPLDKPETYISTSFDKTGSYTLELPAGQYILKIIGNAIERSPELPKEITVVAGQTVNFDFSIDTGIR